MFKAGFMILMWVGLAKHVGATSLDTCDPAPSVRAMLKVVEQKGNALDHLTVDSVASVWEQREDAARNILTEIPMASVKDVEVPARNHQIPLRVYTPHNKRPFQKLAPLVFYHGGGWTLGSLATYDSLARKLAQDIPAVVISVDYRLAPEHPFPAATEDAFAALTWTLRHARELGTNPQLLSVAGDSGGGNLATVTALKARELGIPIALEALFYPSTNISSLDTDSYRQFGQGYLLTQKSVESFRSFYLPNRNDQKSWQASPLLADEASLAKLPPSYILLVGCDPLLSEGLAYARRLQSLGVPTDISTQPDMVHGFLNFFNGATDPALSKDVEQILHEITHRLRQHLMKAERHITLRR